MAETKPTIPNVKERMCCVCRTRKPVTELIRIARIDGTFHIDQIGNMNGRGSHICNTTACIEKCIKTRQLNRSFKQNIPPEIYEKLSHVIANEVKQSDSKNTSKNMQNSF